MPDPTAAQAAEQWDNVRNWLSVVGFFFGFGGLTTGAAALARGSWFASAFKSRTESEIGGLKERVASQSEELAALRQREGDLVTKADLRQVQGELREGLGEIRVRLDRIVDRRVGGVGP